MQQVVHIPSAYDVLAPSLAVIASRSQA